MSATDAEMLATFTDERLERELSLAVKRGEDARHWLCALAAECDRRGRRPLRSRLRALLARVRP